MQTGDLISTTITINEIAEAAGNSGPQWKLTCTPPWPTQYPVHFWIDQGEYPKPSLGSHRVSLKVGKLVKDEYDGSQPWMYKYYIEEMDYAGPEMQGTPLPASATAEARALPAGAASYNPGVNPALTDRYASWQGAMGSRHGMLFNQACEFARIDPGVRERPGDTKGAVEVISAWYRALRDLDDALWPVTLGDKPEASPGEQPEGPYQGIKTTADFENYAANRAYEKAWVPKVIAQALNKVVPDGVKASRESYVAWILKEAVAVANERSLSLAEVAQELDYMAGTP